MQRKSPTDHALAVGKATIQLIPFAGGAIASLIDDYVPTSTQRAQERMLALLQEKVSSLASRIDTNLVDREEFSELFHSCRLLAVRNHREEKLRAAAALLANLLLRPADPAKVPYEELDHLVRCLDALSTGAIAVLGATQQLGMESGAQGRVSFVTLRTKSFPQFETSFLMSLVSELRSFNLVRVQEGAIGTPDLLEVKLQITAIGQRFVERFIEGNM